MSQARARSYHEWRMKGLGKPFDGDGMHRVEQLNP